VLGFAGQMPTFLLRRSQGSSWIAGDRHRVLIVTQVLG